MYIGNTYVLYFQVKSITRMAIVSNGGLILLLKILIAALSVLWINTTITLYKDSR